MVLPFGEDITEDSAELAEREAATRETGLQKLSDFSNTWLPQVKAFHDYRKLKNRSAYLVAEKTARNNVLTKSASDLVERYRVLISQIAERSSDNSDLVAVEAADEQGLADSTLDQGWARWAQHRKCKYD